MSEATLHCDILLKSHLLKVQVIICDSLGNFCKYFMNLLYSLQFRVELFYCMAVQLQNNTKSHFKLKHWLHLHTAHMQAHTKNIASATISYTQSGTEWTCAPGKNWQVFMAARNAIMQLLKSFALVLTPMYNPLKLLHALSPVYCSSQVCQTWCRSVKQLLRLKENEDTCKHQFDNKNGRMCVGRRNFEEEKLEPNQQSVL